MSRLFRFSVFVIAAVAALPALAQSTAHDDTAKALADKASEIADLKKKAEAVSTGVAKLKGDQQDDSLLRQLLDAVKDMNEKIKKLQDDVDQLKRERDQAPKAPAAPAHYHHIYIL